MRKKVIATTAMLVLVLATVAYAQTQQNTYTVTASTSPTSVGSKKHPVPVGIKFDYTVGEASGMRPAVIKQYSIRFAGLRVNTRVAPKCSASKLEESGPSACPKGSIVGTGFIENATGSTANPNDKSVPCNAALSVVNLGGNKASIYVEGDPNQTDPRRKCAIQLASPIDAKFTNRKGESSLDFVVPNSLLHPLATLSNAVVRVESTIKRISKKIHGKRHGFFESVGGCKKGKRKVRVIFTPENGSPATGTDTASCKSGKKRKRRRR